MSPKNTAEAVINMVQKTSCTRIISQEAFAPVIKEIEVELRKKGTKLQYDELPALPKIWPQFGGNLDETVEPFPAPTKPHSKEDIVLYLHSSGSTGLPKPIPQSQVAVLQWCSSRECLSVQWSLYGSHVVISRSPNCARRRHFVWIHAAAYIPYNGHIPAVIYPSGLWICCRALRS